MLKVPYAFGVVGHVYCFPALYGLMYGLGLMHAPFGYIALAIIPSVAPVGKACGLNAAGYVEGLMIGLCDTVGGWEKEYDLVVEGL